MTRILRVEHCSMSMVEAVNLPLPRVPRYPALARAADGLAFVAVVALPWSTSITGIAIGLWVIAVFPTIDSAALRRELTTPAGYLPVLLGSLAVLGMLWAEASWGQRISALNGYLKLLVIPLLLVQFRYSERGWQIVGGYLASITALLLLSWAITIFPVFGSRNPITGMLMQRGIPFRDSITQSGEFVAGAFGLLYLAGEFWIAQKRRLAWLSMAVAAAMLANIGYVANSRTSLLLIPVLLAMLCAMRMRWQGQLAVAVAAVVIVAAVWQSSPYLQKRVYQVGQELVDIEQGGMQTSGGQRLAYWLRSITLIGRAPLIGHGTEAINTIFSRDHTDKTGPAAVITANPHNQILAVALQLGAIGVCVLIAMWAAHFMLFSGGGLVGWLGLVIVVQNVISSLFNSHLLDFTQGWTYVFGVGLLGGLARCGSRFPAVLKPTPPP